MKKGLFLVFLWLSVTLSPAAAEPKVEDWNAVLRQAEGQTVHWNAWGGSTLINGFIAWIGDRVKEEYDITLKHVKLADTAAAVSRVLAEQAAGQDQHGAIDLIWINGENFAAMKRQGLLFGPWAEMLPNRRYIDPDDQTIRYDFTIPVEGFESPWTASQVVFMYDPALLPTPLSDMPALLAWARDNPGRFTYPQPPDFLGSTFLKQALLDLIDDHRSLLKPPASNAAYNRITAPLWKFVDELTPLLWRQGRAYPQSSSLQKQMLADREISLAISFSPGGASAAIANGELPPTVRTFIFDKGTIGNASFVAIPYNSPAKAGAMVLANFLLSPEAQALMQDPKHTGMGTVLAMDQLSAADRKRFDNLDLGAATLTPAQLGVALPEPHPAWMERIEADWVTRFGITN